MSSRTLRTPMLLTAALFALAACGMDSPPPPPAPPPPAAPQSAASDSHLEAMQRARAVEATLEEGKDRTDAALEAAEAK